MEEEAEPPRPSQGTERRTGREGQRANPAASLPD